MATTTNYGWTTPDDTALVKDGASAIRTLGTSIDTTTKNLNPSTTLGDIEYRSSTSNTNTRLGIGSTGNVLTVSGGVPAWVAPGGGISTWTVLNSGGTSLSGAQTITVSGITGQKEILVILEGASSTSDGTQIQIRPNADSGTNYTNYGFQYHSPSTYSSANGQGFADQGFSASTEIRIGVMSDNAASVIYGACHIETANTTGWKKFTATGGGTTAAGTGQRNYATQGIWEAAAEVTSIQIRCAGGTLDAGLVYVLGGS